MKGEIDRDWYCSGKLYYPDGFCKFGEIIYQCKRSNCLCYHRKHPTPAQFHEEYGVEYPEYGAVYYLRDGS